jgi:hypothetical protein
MMKKTIPFLLILCMNGIAGIAQQTPSDQDKIKGVIYDNVKALQKEDVEMELATIHTKSAFYASTKEMAPKLFAMADSKYDISYLKILSIGPEEATVRVIQLTKRISGPMVRDTKMTLLHTLKKEDDRWKIFDTKVEKTEFLN